MTNDNAQKEDSSNTIFWVIGVVATIIIILMLVSAITSDDNNEVGPNNDTNAVPTIQEDNDVVNNQGEGVRSNDTDDFMKPLINMNDKPVLVS